MKDTSKINLIFDCDGTLVDSYPAVIDCIQRAFRTYQIEVDPDHVRELVLSTTVLMGVKQLSEEFGIDYDEVFTEIQKSDENWELCSIYPHLLDVLRNDRFQCFVYTHRGENSKPLFERFGIYQYFTEVVDRTYEFKRKPDGEGVEYLVNKYHLDPKRTFYVGDRSLDIECGRNAGVGTIFFLSAGIDIPHEGADYVVKDLGEIEGLFDGEIETDRLLLRRFRQTDYDDLYEFLAQLRDDEFEGYPEITYENGRSHLEERMSSDEYYAIVLKETGKVIGNIYCGNRPFEAREVGYIVNRNFQREGYALEALNAISEALFQRGTHRIYAECDPRNEASWRLLSKAGFRREAELKQNVWFWKDSDGHPIWKDTYVYARLNGERIGLLEQ